MIAIQQLTMIHPALLSFGETVDLALPGHLPLHVENIGSGPRGFPALAVTQYAPSVDGVVRDPEMRFELEIEQGHVTALHPYYFRNDCTGTEELAVSEGKIDLNAISLQEEAAAVWSRDLEQHGYFRALVD